FFILSSCSFYSETHRPSPSSESHCLCIMNHTVSVFEFKTCKVTTNNRRKRGSPCFSRRCDFEFVKKACCGYFNWVVSLSVLVHMMAFADADWIFKLAWKLDDMKKKVLASVSTTSTPIHAFVEGIHVHTSPVHNSSIPNSPVHISFVHTPRLGTTLSVYV
ncbi:unnamed protein product, partial [Brassica rapa subsp. trilocularis]